MRPTLTVPEMLSMAWPSAAGAIPLNHLAVVEVQGPDAGSFLQGQLTQDVLTMRAEEARAGGFCSAKGRLLANFILIHPQENTWWLVTSAELREPLAKRLKMFMLRAKCTINVRSDMGVWGSGTPGALPPWRVERHPAAPGTAAQDRPQAVALQVGWWAGRSLWLAAADAAAPLATTSATPSTAPIAPAVAPHEDPGAETPEQSQWRHADVAAGWPWIQAATVEQFVPQMINFEVLGGVNFRKGCYPGQEVVARSQYRSTLKRRMALFELASSTTPAPGAEIFHSEDPGQPAGLVVNAAADPARTGRSLLLAEVKLAALETGTLHLSDAHGLVLSARALPYRIPTESEM